MSEGDTKHTTWRDRLAGTTANLWRKETKDDRPVLDWIQELEDWTREMEIQDWEIGKATIKQRRKEAQEREEETIMDDVLDGHELADEIIRRARHWTEDGDAPRARKREEWGDPKNWKEAERPRKRRKGTNQRTLTETTSKGNRTILSYFQTEKRPATEPVNELHQPRGESRRTESMM